MGEIVERASAARRSAATSERGEIWISLLDAEAVTGAAALVEARLAGGEVLPLAGVTVGVKDNIDVAGSPTTAACPAYTRWPVHDAPAVRALIHAGAVVIGKTNMDQFATGLVGTRSPYGAVRNAWDPRYVSGGSSSGSAVAVALGQVDLALGTDTAGSGRVPAAFNGIIGVKPTRGLISTRGTVPACPSLDCISIFTADAVLARRSFDVLAQPDPEDPYHAPTGAVAGPPVARIAVPEPGKLDISGADRVRFEHAIERLVELGAEIDTVDIAPFLQAGELLYDGALVAERYAAVGEFVAAHPGDVDPVVAKLILDSAALPAHRFAADLGRLAELRLTVAATFSRADALVLPAAPIHPRIDEVAADPVGLNERIGLYSHFCNLLDLCAVSLPVERSGPDGLPWGITAFAPAFADRRLLALAARFVDAGANPTVISARGDVPPRRSGVVGPLPDAPAGATPAGSGRTLVVVAGAHLRGQPLNPELVALGGRFVEQTTTTDAYRLYALAPPSGKPALVRAVGGGAPIEVEIWSLDDSGFARLVAALPLPMAIGLVEVDDRRWLPGFLGQPLVVDEGTDITAYGGWRRYLAERSSAEDPIGATD